MTDIEPVASYSELDAYMRQAEMLAKSQLVPQQYRGKAADILVASLAGREVGMGPIAALSYVIVIQGKPTINAEGRVALIRKAGHSISGAASAEKATVTGKRRDTGDEMTVEWTIDMAKRAGLTSQTWKQYPEAMLWARAVSQLSRMLFADVLMGVSYDPEELGATVDQHGAVIDVPAIEAPDEMACPRCGEIVAGARTDREPMRDHMVESHSYTRGEDGMVRPPPPVEPESVPVGGSPDMQPPSEGDAPTSPPAPRPAGPDEMSDAQSRMLHALLRSKCGAVGPSRHPALSRLLDRKITSAKEVTAAEAGELIDRLTAMPDLDMEPATT